MNESGGNIKVHIEDKEGDNIVNLV